MRIGRFLPPKYRGKVQNIELSYTHSPKMPKPTPNFLIIPKNKLKKNKKLKKRGGQ
jgi:hypothetical protein